MAMSRNDYILKARKKTRGSIMAEYEDLVHNAKYYCQGFWHSPSSAVSLGACDLSECSRGGGTGAAVK